MCRVPVSRVWPSEVSYALPMQRSVPQRIVRRVALSIPRRVGGDIAEMWRGR
jgi:hypothetical protein